MITLVIKKENYPEFLSFKGIKHFKHKFIRYYLTKLYYKIRGFEVEELKGE